MENNVLLWQDFMNFPTSLAFVFVENKVSIIDLQGRAGCRVVNSDTLIYLPSPGFDMLRIREAWDLWESG